MPTNRPTIPAWVFAQVIVLGLFFEALGIGFELLDIGQGLGGRAMLVGQSLAQAGGGLIIGLTLAFMVICLSDRPGLNDHYTWFSRGRFMAAAWCHLDDVNQPVRLLENGPHSLLILAYLRARFLAVDADFYAPMGCGVSYGLKELKDETET